MIDIDFFVGVSVLVRVDNAWMFGHASGEPVGGNEASSADYAVFCVWTGVFPNSMVFLVDINEV